MSTITQPIVAMIEQLKQEGSSDEEISRFTGRSQETVAAVLDGRHVLQVAVTMSTKNALRLRSRQAIVAIVGERTDKHIGRGVSFLPTPQQIEAACQAIRETWSEAEHYSRRDFTPAAVRRPMAPLSLADYD